MKKTIFGISHEREEDAFLPYRDRMVYFLGLASIFVFLPFAINNFIQGRVALGIATLCIVLVLAVDAFTIYRGKVPPLPLWLLAFPALGGFVYTMMAKLYIGLAWAYPAMILFYFVLPQRSAIVISSLIAITVTVLSWLWLDIAVTIRICATLTLTGVLTNIFVNIITTLHRQLKEQAIVDPLTGAYNRRHMNAVLENAVERMKRSAVMSSLLLIDIDHFKRINDTHGHAIGDEVLKGLVSAVRNKVRKIDVLFRSGGEEFVLYLPDTPAAGAAVVAKELCRLVADSRLSCELKVTVSIGVSEYRRGESMDDWMRRGDDALYQAKETGRNRVEMAAA